MKKIAATWVFSATFFGLLLWSDVVNGIRGGYEWMAPGVTLLTLAIFVFYASAALYWIVRAAIEDSKR